MTKQRKLDQMIASHEPELTPRRDLWRGVEAAINHAELDAQDGQKTSTKRASAKGRHWSVGWAVAASLLVAITVLLISPWQTQAPGENSHMALVELLVNEHQQQRQMLLTSYQTAGYQTASMNLNDDLDQLRKANETIQLALAEDPQNRSLIELLVWVQRQELELLKAGYQPQRGLQQL